MSNNAASAQPYPGFVVLRSGGAVRLATLGRRFFARVVDVGILLVVSVPLLWQLVGALDSRTVRRESAEPYSTVTGAFAARLVLLVVLALVSLPAVVFLYDWVFIALKGRTPGKVVAGVKVVRDQNAEVPGWGAAFIRGVIPAAASYVCGPFALLCHLSVLFDGSGRRQAWHDQAASSLVISTLERDQPATLG